MSSRTCPSCGLALATRFDAHAVYCPRCLARRRVRVELVAAVSTTPSGSATRANASAA
jgi:uncharacterized Zn finger protein (UPF0148 family)